MYNHKMSWLVSNHDDSENSGEIVGQVDRNVEIGLRVGDAIDLLASGDIGPEDTASIIVTGRDGDNVAMFEITIAMIDARFLS